MSWEQLEAILKENREKAREEAEAPVTKCPDCAYFSLIENKHGEKLCPICGWRGR